MSTEMPKYILDFVTAVYPEAPQLALASFNEEKCLKDATETINSSRSGYASLLALAVRLAGGIRDMAIVFGEVVSEQELEAAEQVLALNESTGRQEHDATSGSYAPTQPAAPVGHKEPK